MLDANPALTVEQVREILRQTAEDWGPTGQDSDYGWGRLDGYRAVARAASRSDAGAPPVPGHLAFTGTLTAGARADHSFTVSDTAYPINATLLMPGSGNSPDFDLYLYNPDGTEVGRSTGTSRQEQISYSPPRTGTYRLQVRSYSGAGEYVLDVSAGTSGATDAPPQVAFDAPGEGAVLSGLVEVKVRATDDVQVARVELSIDGGAYINITSSFDGTHYRYFWETATLPDGNHTLTARATDSASQQTVTSRTVRTQNGGDPGSFEWSRTGQVSPGARDLELTLNVQQPGFVDFTLAWPTGADLDLFVYAPDGSLAGRAFTLNNPERLRIDTVRHGAGAYRVRVNLYSGVTSTFTLTARGYRAYPYTGQVSPGSRNVTHTARVDYTGLSRVVLSWPAGPDLDFFVYDPLGRERARAFTLNNPEQREFNLDMTGDWSVRVNLYSGAATGYNLHWFMPAAILN